MMGMPSILGLKSSKLAEYAAKVRARPAWPDSHASHLPGFVHVAPAGRVSRDLFCHSSPVLRAPLSPTAYSPACVWRAGLPGRARIGKGFRPVPSARAEDGMQICHGAVFVVIVGVLNAKGQGDGPVPTYPLIYPLTYLCACPRTCCLRHAACSSSHQQAARIDATIRRGARHCSHCALQALPKR